MLTNKFLGYKVLDLNEDGELKAPCSCGCKPGKSAEGHYLCGFDPDDLIDAEKRGEVYRSFNGGWAFYLTRLGRAKVVNHDELTTSGNRRWVF